MKAKLIVADSERNADILYASGFMAPDAFIWFAAPGGQSGVILSRLEFSRGKKECRPGVEVLCVDDFFQDEERRRENNLLLPRLAEFPVRSMKSVVALARASTLPAMDPLASLTFLLTASHISNVSCSGQRTLQPALIRPISAPRDRRFPGSQGPSPCACCSRR